MRLFVAIYPPDQVRLHLRRHLSAPRLTAGSPADVSIGGAAGVTADVAAGLTTGAAGLTSGGPAGVAAALTPRLTAVEKWHITLAFLGEVPPERLTSMITALGAVPIPRNLDPAPAARPDPGPKPDPAAGSGRAVGPDSGSGPAAGPDPGPGAGRDLGSGPGPGPDGSSDAGCGAGLELRLSGGGDFHGRVLWAGVRGDLSDLSADIRKALGLHPEPLRAHLTVSYTYDEAVAQALRSYEGPPWHLDKIHLVQSENRSYRTLASF